MRKVEIVHAYGDELIRSSHKTTLEITRDETLTERGDCIIAVNADKGAADLSNSFKEYARRSDAEITITIQVGDEKETVKARGDPKLSFTYPNDIVVRRSTYVCGRTVAVKADKAASDLSRRLVERLRNLRQKVRITLTVEAP